MLRILWCTTGLTYMLPFSTRQLEGGEAVVVQAAEEV
jgi:hypothetical protein